MNSERFELPIPVENSGLSGLGEISRQHLTGSYPPFYHLVVAGTWAVFGKSVDVAQLANLPALAVLMFATYGIAATILSQRLAALAAVLTTLPVPIGSRANDD